MARSVRTYLTDSPTSADVRMAARKHMTKKEFSQNLYRAMLRKGWKQADLAREAGVLRDSVSNYIRGNTLPDPVNLKKLSKALGIAEADLLPNFDETTIDAETDPPLEIKTSSQDPSRSWVRLNREVSTATLAKILQVLDEDQAAPARKTR